MKSPTFDQSALDALRSRVHSPDALQAFDLLVQYGLNSGTWHAGPGGQGLIHDFRFTQARPRGWPFSFTTSREHLLFQVRTLGRRTLGVNRGSLGKVFGEVRKRANDELHVVVRSRQEAQAVIDHLLARWPVGDSVPEQPERMTEADILRAALAIRTSTASGGQGESELWDVVIEGRLYSPRGILAMVRREKAESTGQEGDDESHCHRILEDLGFEIVRKGDQRAARESMDQRIERAIRLRSDIGPTEKLALVLARRGQGAFRANLEQVEGVCRVTGLMDRRHLRASHMKAWRECDDFGKLDGHNGLLLSPHIHHLFEQGYVSFSDAGELLVSRQLNSAVLKRWGVSLPVQARPFSPEQMAYLTWHRENVFDKRETGRRRTQE